MADLVTSSMDVYFGYVLLSAVPSSGPFDTDIDLSDPVNSDGEIERPSPGEVGPTDGLFCGDELRGSRVMLPVSRSGPRRLLWLVALPEVLGRGLAVRRKSDC